MFTKYNLGEDIWISCHIVGININRDGRIFYELRRDNKTEEDDSEWFDINISQDTLDKIIFTPKED